jgi:hypothetical protein
VPVTRIKFGVPWAPYPEALDIHLLRGQSTGNLHDQLYVQDAADSKWKSVVAEYTGNDIEISFVPVFKIVHDDTVPAYSNFGISVDKKTGRVSVDNTWTSDGSPHNFILEAFISDNGNGIPWIKIASAVVRIHVHLSVASIRLTPSLLSLRRQKPSGQAEDAGPQFAVRAEFDDGTTGDISYSDDLTFTPATWFQGRLIRIPASAANTVAPFAVTVTASAKWNSKSAQAQLEVLQPWATEPNVPTADLLDGQPGVWDGTIKPETVPNIIFLGCGFTAASQAMFRMVADTIVHKLKTDRLLQPYGYLATSMNYWSVMVPAPDAGVSVRSEVQQLTEGGQLFAQLVPTPVEAPPASTDWDLQHLIYAAGLPVPADLKLVRQVDPNQQGQPPQPIATLDALRALPLNQLDFQLLFNRWAAIMRLDDPVNMIAALSRSVVQQWIALADRAFIDEVNGFPAVSVGAPPMAGINDTGLLALHDLRGEQSAPITAFFQRVTATPRNGVTVTLDDTGAAQPGLGYLWAEDRAGFAFDNRSFVVALNNSTDGRARIAEPGVQTSLNLSGVGPDGKTFPMKGFPVTRNPGSSGLALALPTDTLMLRPPTWRVFAHELTHTFHLGDEYVERADTYTGPDTDFDEVPNLMTEAGARIQGETQKISFPLIKWNWHRIRKASVIRLPIDDRLANGTFRVFVRKGTGFQLAVGDFVLLRQRTRRTVIKRDPLTSNVEFRVEEIHPDNVNDPNDKINMTIVIKNDSPLVDVTPFGPGSLIYLPIPTSPPEMLRPYLTLVSPLAERIMTGIGGSMLGTACDIFFQTLGRGAYTQAPNVPAGLNVNIPDKDLPGLVGAYFGGSQWACGVLRPTGQCLMRESWDEETTLCPVCRYALVEWLNPEQHWQIDRDYDGKYRL